ncbi:MAG: prevent-host-death family protein [Actinomycetota bacterium]|nr:prevent-host-death family protein [Actinomycetota bacterium]
MAAGEDFEVTDGGQPVALLVPVPQDPWAELLASGRVQPPDDDTDLLAESPEDFGVDASRQLARQRQDER